MSSGIPPRVGVPFLRNPLTSIRNFRVCFHSSLPLSEVSESGWFHQLNLDRKVNKQQLMSLTVTCETCETSLASVSSLSTSTTVQIKTGELRVLTCQLVPQSCKVGKGVFNNFTFYALLVCISRQLI